MKTNVIEISHVSKRFHTLRALHDVSLEVRAGEVLGVLGPNGAGKTTLLKLIAGFLVPDAGMIRPRGDRWPAIGYKPERLLFPPKMRVADYLRLIARMSGLTGGEVDAAVRRSLALGGLTGAAGKRLRECSKGMRQRVGLAQALLGDPPLVLLDEPSNGLDPAGQEDVQAQITALHRAGKTILLSSHQLQEVTDVCTDLVILNHGRVLYRNDMATALAVRPHAIITVDRPLAPVARLLQSLGPDVEVEEQLVVLNHDAMQLRPQVLSLLVGLGYDVMRVDQQRITLAEIYAEAVK